MKVLVLSDIHANLEALRAVLAAVGQLGPIDQLWNLGDAVGYGASPNEVLDLLRPLATINVRGNHDRVSCGITSAAGFNPTARAAAHWTQTALTADHLQWLRQMPTGPLKAAEGVLCAHGSPLNEDHYLLSPQDAVHPLQKMAEPIAFFGHTHLQGVFEQVNRSARDHQPIRPGAKTPESITLQLQPDTRYLINPGSVGQPRDFDWRAAFALFDTEARTITFHRIPYDVATTQQRILAAGLPQRLAHRLLEGS